MLWCSVVLLLSVAAISSGNGSFQRQLGEKRVEATDPKKAREPLCGCSLRRKGGEKLE